MGWLAVSGGYEVTLDGDTLVCRNAAGKTLRSVPKAIREDPVTVGLRQLTEWLKRHEAQCRADVERWMVRSLPVPAVLLAEVWADDVWAAAARNLVVTTPDGAQVGFLRDAGEKGVGIVDLDGDTVRLDADQLLIPHPVLLDDIDDLREFAADLEFTQSIDQLFREVWARPAEVDPAATRISAYAGGRYAELRHLTARAAQAGFRVRGGYAVCRVFENDSVVEARSWVGAEDPYYETETGDLIFTRPDGVALPLGEVGPVAWSEGHRMAATLYAGRVVEKEEAA
ncbi:DUF4132 domain-containing protein [Cryptosporangium arvum]|uniref:DUF4132 domain-containing protein n=1 Tax=Cryptosporangium arvum DSM 44712 TaxID=927661 RepID=A0A010YZS8_9ACTN|nr:DUF4132 domain-containing protein [Cryptosporangium arvum]EXG80708.1 hypothetical protein CryarDRAFT_1795 [Cryptosporangium arvum DSM 44712]